MIKQPMEIRLHFPDVREVPKGRPPYDFPITPTRGDFIVWEETRFQVTGLVYNLDLGVIFIVLVRTDRKVGE